MQPTVEHRNGYTVIVTDTLHRTGADKISPQDNEQKTQGIRLVWDDTGRQYCMGMAAGITDIPWYSNRVGFLCPPIPFHQISVIVSEKAQTSPGRTVWTGLVRGQWCPGCMDVAGSLNERLTVLKTEQGRCFLVNLVTAVDLIDKKDYNMARKCVRRHVT